MTMLSVFYLVLLLFLSISIFSSQYIPDIFFATVGNQQSKILSFLAKTKDLPRFQALYPEVKVMLSQNTQVINKEAKTRHDQIVKLENLLTVNPDAPEVLYGLYLLYEADGNITAANTYLQRARAIDPVIGK